MYKFISLLALVILFKSSLGQTNHYLTIAQLERAIHEDWQYLHDLLDTKKFVFFETAYKDFDNYPSYQGFENNYDIKYVIYYYKRDVKDTEIKVDNVYSKSNRHIMINTRDEGFYMFLKNQAKQQGYTMVSPRMYKSTNFNITFDATKAPDVATYGDLIMYNIAFFPNDK